MAAVVVGAAVFIVFPTLGMVEAGVGVWLARSPGPAARSFAIATTTLVIAWGLMVIVTSAGGSPLLRLIVIAAAAVDGALMAKAWFNRWRSAGET